MSTKTVYKGISLLCESTDNFMVWKKAVKTRLNKEGCWECVSKTDRPDQIAEDVWNKNKWTALDIIQTYIGGSIESETIDFENPKMLWDHLESTFTQKKGAEKLAILEQLLSCKLHDTNETSTYVKQFTERKSKCIEVGWNMDEVFYALMMLRGLPPQFDSLKQTMMARGDALEYLETTEQVKLQGLLIGNSEKEKEDSGLKVTESERMKCSFCKRQNHLKPDCYKYKRFLKNKKKKKNRESDTKRKDDEDNDSDESDDDAYFAAIDKSINYDSCYLVSSRKPPQNTCFTVSRKTRRHIHELRKRKQKDNRFISDSGATSHMCHNIELFSDIKMVNHGEHWINVGNGQRVPVDGRGTIRMKSKNGRFFTLKDVLYASALSCNLFSIRKCQLARYDVLFPGRHPEFMFIKNKHQERVLSAKVENNLYYLQSSVCLKSNGLLAESIWHQRLGHTSFKRMSRIRQWSKAFHIKRDRTNNVPCFGCAKGKLKRRRRKTVRTHYATEKLESTHSDVIGPFPKGKSGYRYVVNFIDEATRRAKSYFMKKKNEVLKYFKIYKLEVENEMQSNPNGRRTLLKLQSDGGGEYVNSAFKDFTQTHGIQHLITNADEPRQNGLSEKFGSDQQDSALSMLKHSKLDTQYWPYAFKMATYLHNILPSKHLQYASPHEKWYDQVPNLNGIRTFGCDAWVRVPHPSKGHDKAKLCTFLGYRDGLKGYLFEDRKTKRIIKSGDAVFYEGEWKRNGIQNLADSSAAQDILWTSILDATSKSEPVPLTSVVPASAPEPSSSTIYLDDDDDDDDTPIDRSMPTPSVPPTDAPISSPTPTNVFSDSENVFTPDDDPMPANDSGDDDLDDHPIYIPHPPALPPSPPSSPALAPRRIDFTDPIVPAPTRASKRPRRSTADYGTTHKVLKRLRCNLHTAYTRRDKAAYARSASHLQFALRNIDYSYATVAGGDSFGDIRVPTTYAEALASPQRDKWKAAIKDELDSLKANDTWVPGATEVPEGRKTVSTKWVFAIKTDANNNIQKYKARLVARGFTQQRGLDFHRTFAPVMQPDLLRSLLAISAKEDWEIQQIDIKTAFLYGTLDEEIYIELPNGMKSKNNVRRLNKALYGLKQAGRQWYGKFSESLYKLGFERLQGDPCCYRRINSEGHPIFIMIHVDDAIFFGKDLSEINAIKLALQKEYQISDIGDMRYCLGWEIERNRKERTLKVKQTNYINEILKKFKMDKCNPVSTPACPNVTFSRAMSPTSQKERNHMSRIPYLEVLGSLIYLATSTRPDISYAVSELSKFASNPGKDHWTGLKRIMRYIKGTSEHGLQYGNGKIEITGHVDANYARCPDTRRSRYGGYLSINNGPVTWRSKMESIVTLSSMESEYVGACEISRIIKWLRGCMGELGFEQTKATVLYTDNKSSKLFAEETMVQNRSKHIDTRYHFIRDQIRNKELRLKYKKTSEMPADAMTKPLAPRVFYKLRSAMGIKSCSKSCGITSLPGDVER